MQVNSVSTGGTGKAIASAIIPGLGQFCDGRKKDGLTFFGVSSALFIGRKLLNTPPTDVANLSTKKLPGKLKGIAAAVLATAALAWRVINVVDAYKGGIR